jgi:hypothetical protein
MDLYHKHIIYDIVNFTGYYSTHCNISNIKTLILLCRVSFSASLLTLWITADAKEGKYSWQKPLKLISIVTSNMFLATLFSILYLTYVILFAIALGSWDYNRSGFCYHYNLVALSSSSHPYVDKVYLGLTSCCMFFLLIFCSILGKPSSFLIKLLREKIQKKIDRSIERRPEEPSRMSPWARKMGRSILVRAFSLFCGCIWFSRLAVIIMALLQFPLHLYMVVALRTSNNPYLKGDSENSWGFGQVVALVLIIPVLIELFSSWTGMKCPV